MLLLFNMDSEITWQHSRSPGRWFSWQKRRSPERKAEDKLHFHHFTRLLTFKYSWKQCNKATQQNTSVVSEGGVRVPKRGVVKFSQNLSLWFKKKKRKKNTIQHVNHVVFHLHVLFQLKVRLRTFTYFVRKTEMALSLRSCQRARRKARPARCSSGGHQYLPCCLESIRSNTTWRQLHSPSRNSYKFKTRMSLMKLQQWEK